MIDDRWRNIDTVINRNGQIMSKEELQSFNNHVIRLL